MMQQTFIGVDVAKGWLDIHHPERKSQRIENTPKGAKAFAHQTAKEGAWIIFEASGGYDRVLREALEEAEVRFSRVNPRQARDIARAMGVIGKTDQVDARMLSELGARLNPPPTEPLAASRKALQAQTARSRQLVDLRKKEDTRLKETADPDVRADIRSLITVLERRIAKIEKEMVRLVRADQELAEVNDILQSAPGVGPIVAATLISELPELGRVDRRAIAALAGLAPVARDSGKRSGPRAIEGGRPAARTILYLAGLHATRVSSNFSGFRKRLEGAGKRPKAAIIATARKLLVTLNAMIARGQRYVPQVPSWIQLPALAAIVRAFGKTAKVAGAIVGAKFNGSGHRANLLRAKPSTPTTKTVFSMYQT